MTDSEHYTAANIEIWESRYRRGEVVNRYPFDQVVSFVLRNFGKMDRSFVRILDYGCGGGNHCAFLAREGFDWYGIDFSSSAIAHAAKVVADTGVKVTTDKLICSDFVDMPFRDDYFDAIIDRQSLDQNMAVTLPRLVAEIRRILKPGGVYFGINFSDQHPTLIYGNHLGNGDYAEFTSGPLRGIGARHFFSRNELLTLFSEFLVIDLQVLSLRSLAHVGQGSEEFILVARKPGETEKEKAAD